MPPTTRAIFDGSYENEIVTRLTAIENAIDASQFGVMGGQFLLNQRLDSIRKQAGGVGVGGRVDLSIDKLRKKATDTLRAVDPKKTNEETIKQTTKLFKEREKLQKQLLIFRDRNKEIVKLEKSLVDLSGKKIKVTKKNLELFAQNNKLLQEQIELNERLGKVISRNQTDDVGAALAKDLANQAEINRAKQAQFQQIGRQQAGIGQIDQAIEAAATQGRLSGDVLKAEKVRREAFEKGIEQTQRYVEQLDQLADAGSEAFLTTEEGVKKAAEALDETAKGTRRWVTALDGYVKATNALFTGTALLKAFDTIQKGLIDIRRELNGASEALVLMQKQGLDPSGFSVFNDIREMFFLNADAATDFATTAVTSFNNFEQALRRVGTVFATEKGFEERAEDLKQFGIEIGRLVNTDLRNTVTETEALAATYEALSSGFSSSSEALQVMTAGLKLAASSGADSGEVMRLLGKTMNAYNLSADQAAETAAKLNAIVENGITTVDELSLSFGQLSSASAAVGVSLDEIGAALATLTTRGTSTARAVTQLEGLLSTFVDPSFADRLEKLNIDLNVNKATIETKGLITTIKEIDDALEGQRTKWAQIVPEANSYRAIVGLLTDDLQNAEKVTNKLLSTTADKLEEVFDIVLKDNQIAKFEQIFNKLNSTLINVGRGLAPIFNQGLDFLVDFTENLAKFTEENEGLIKLFVNINLSIKALSGAAGVLTDVIKNLVGIFVTWRFVSGKLFSDLGNLFAVTDKGKQVVASAEGVFAKFGARLQNNALLANENLSAQQKLITVGQNLIGVQAKSAEQLQQMARMTRQEVQMMEDLNEVERQYEKQQRINNSLTNKATQGFNKFNQALQEPTKTVQNLGVSLGTKLDKGLSSINSAFDVTIKKAKNFRRSFQDIDLSLNAAKSTFLGTTKNLKGFTGAITNASGGLADFAFNAEAISLPQGGLILLTAALAGLKTGLDAVRQNAERMQDVLEKTQQGAKSFSTAIKDSSLNFQQIGNLSGSDIVNELQKVNRGLREEADDFLETNQFLIDRYDDLIEQREMVEKQLGQSELVEERKVYKEQLDNINSELITLEQDLTNQLSDELKTRVSITDNTLEQLLDIQQGYLDGINRLAEQTDKANFPRIIDGIVKKLEEVTKGGRGGLGGQIGEDLKRLRDFLTGEDLKDITLAEETELLLQTVSDSLGVTFKATEQAAKGIFETQMVYIDGKKFEVDIQKQLNKLAEDKLSMTVAERKALDRAIDQEKERLGLIKQQAESDLERLKAKERELLDELSATSARGLQGEQVERFETATQQGQANILLGEIAQRLFEERERSRVEQGASSFFPDLKDGFKIEQFPPEALDAIEANNPEALVKALKDAGFDDIANRIAELQTGSFKDIQVAFAESIALAGGDSDKTLASQIKEVLKSIGLVKDSIDNAAEGGENLKILETVQDLVSRRAADLGTPGTLEREREQQFQSAQDRLTQQIELVTALAEAGTSEIEARQFRGEELTEEEQQDIREQSRQQQQQNLTAAQKELLKDAKNLPQNIADQFGKVVKNLEDGVISASDALKQVDENFGVDIVEFLGADQAKEFYRQRIELIKRTGQETQENAQREITLLNELNQTAFVGSTDRAEEIRKLNEQVAQDNLKNEQQILDQMQKMGQFTEIEIERQSKVVEAARQQANNLALNNLEIRLQEEFTIFKKGQENRLQLLNNLQQQRIGDENRNQLELLELQEDANVKYEELLRERLEVEQLSSDQRAKIILDLQKNQFEREKIVTQQFKTQLTERTEAFQDYVDQLNQEQSRIKTGIEDIRNVASTFAQAFSELGTGSSDELGQLVGQRAGIDLGAQARDLELTASKELLDIEQQRSTIEIDRQVEQQKALQQQVDNTVEIKEATLARLEAEKATTEEIETARKGLEAALKTQKEVTIEVETELGILEKQRQINNLGIKQQELRLESIRAVEKVEENIGRKRNAVQTFQARLNLLEKTKDIYEQTIQKEIEYQRTTGNGQVDWQSIYRKRKAISMDFFDRQKKALQLNHKLQIAELHAEQEGILIKNQALSIESEITKQKLEQLNAQSEIGLLQSQQAEVELTQERDDIQQRLREIKIEIEQDPSRATELQKEQEALIKRLTSIESELEINSKLQDSTQAIIDKNSLLIESMTEFQSRLAANSNQLQLDFEERKKTLALTQKLEKLELQLQEAQAKGQKARAARIQDQILDFTKAIEKSANEAAAKANAQFNTGQQTRPELNKVTAQENNLSSKEIVIKIDKPEEGNRVEKQILDILSNAKHLKPTTEPLEPNQLRNIFADLKSGTGFTEDERGQRQSLDLRSKDQFIIGEQAKTLNLQMGGSGDIGGFISAGKPIQKQPPSGFIRSETGEQRNLQFGSGAGSTSKLNAKELLKSLGLDSNIGGFVSATRQGQPSLNQVQEFVTKSIGAGTTSGLVPPSTAQGQQQQQEPSSLVNVQVDNDIDVKPRIEVDEKVVSRIVNKHLKKFEKDVKREFEALI